MNYKEIKKNENTYFELFMTFKFINVCFNKIFFKHPLLMIYRFVWKLGIQREIFYFFIKWDKDNYTLQSNFKYALAISSEIFVYLEVTDKVKSVWKNLVKDI